MSIASVTRSIFLLTVLLISTPAHAVERLLVFAPSSLTEAIGNLGQAFEGQTGIPVKISIAGTAQLARQIEAGAPADIFISADADWMQWLRQRDLLDPGTGEIIIAGNSLVVAVRRETENWADIKQMLTASRFAMADPGSVPAGRYAKQALTSRGWWEAAKSNASYGENVRITLRRLVLGEVGAALVYASDLEAEPGVRAALTFRDDEHKPILTYAAATTNAPAHAAKFLTFLRSEKALSILLKAGLKPPPE